MDWRAYWEAFPRKFGERDWCKQVGRTANGGVPTAEPELAVVVGQVRDGLELGDTDVLLDLCCGNGLLTRRLARSCQSAVGLDFSSSMIALAREHQGASNLRYVEGSALELAELELGGAAFSKISMFESLQYFDSDQLPAILDGINRISVQRPVAYFSGVLDRERIWRFFDTPERRAAYERQKREGREVMGNWWLKSEIAEIAEAAGYACDFIAQDPALNTAHYRFDVRLEKR